MTSNTQTMAAIWIIAFYIPYIHTTNKKEEHRVWNLVVYNPNITIRSTIIVVYCADIPKVECNINHQLNTFVMTLNTITRMLLENNKHHILTQAAQIDCGMVSLTSNLRKVVVRVSKYRLKDNQKFSNDENYCYVNMAVLEYNPYKEYEQYFKIQYPDGSFDWVIGQQLESTESIGWIITDEPIVIKNDVEIFPIEDQ